MPALFRFRLPASPGRPRRLALLACCLLLLGLGVAAVAPAASAASTNLLSNGDFATKTTRGAAACAAVPRDGPPGAARSALPLPLRPESYFFLLFLFFLPFLSFLLFFAMQITPLHDRFRSTKC